MQALFLLTGIIVANVLLAGTLLINAQARSSYAQGEQYLNASPVGQIRQKDGTRNIDESDYVSLRRQGFDMLAPMLRHMVRSENGEALELLGIDVFAMPRPARTFNFSDSAGPVDGSLMGFAFPPYQLWAAPARFEQLSQKRGRIHFFKRNVSGLFDDDDKKNVSGPFFKIRLTSGEILPPLISVSNQQLGHRLLIDIEALQSLSGNDTGLTSILVFPASAERMTQLLRALPAYL